LKPNTTLEIMENRNFFEFSTQPLKILVKYTDFEYVPQVLTYQNDTAVHFKKGVYKLSKPIFDIRLDDY
ncbi:MAG: hypothetical protein Q7T20_03535, partial [Saprospiraceae bacterium]|nr:hypothetical protein [Saprospiraceae bacterium]